MKIVFITSRVPYPLEKGDKLRAFNHLKLLNEKHEVTLIAFSDTPVHPDAKIVLSRYCKNLRIYSFSLTLRIYSLIHGYFNHLPFSTGYFYNFLVQRIVNNIIKDVQPAHIYCQLTRVAEYVKNRNDIPKTLDYQDAFALGFEKRISKVPFYLRWLYKLEFQRLKKYEAELFDKFENKIIISAQDRDNIAHPEKEKITIVPNGVDFEYYAPQEKEKKYDLLFTGNMAYPPNVESVVFLVKEVLPLVKKIKPGIKLLIAGATPTPRVIALQDNNVEVSGWVDDLRECYAAAKLFIAPMQISIGLQNKLLEAMAMRLPCITSELANNALGATHNKNIVVCNRPQEYAYAIIRLLDNPAQAAEIAATGHDFVKQNYGWRKMTQPLLQLIEAT